MLEMGKEDRIETLLKHMFDADGKPIGTLVNAGPNFDGSHIISVLDPEVTLYSLSYLL